MTEQVATAREQKPVMVVAVPAKPPIEKVVALKRVWLDYADSFQLRIVFCNVNNPSVEQREQWKALCSPGIEPYYVDVGEKKYHRLGGSATEVEVAFSETNSGKTWYWLVELVNRNNNTGFLKNTRHSLAKGIREVYHVMESGDVSQEVVLDHARDVVDAFFWRQNQRTWQDLSTDPQYADLKKLWDGFSVSEAEVLPFTLQQYFKQLFLSGRSASEIVTKITWWDGKMKKAAARRDDASRKQYRPERVRYFQVGKTSSGSANLIRTGIIHVADRFEAHAATYQLVGSGKLAVGIIRNARGQVHIQSSFKHPGLNFDALAAFLQAAEPGRWYYETRFGSGRIPMIMNGSDQFTGELPTSFTDEELLDLVCRFVRFGQ